VTFLNCHLNHKYILCIYTLSVEKITSVRVKVKVVLTGAVIRFLRILLCAFFTNFETHLVQIYITVELSGASLCIVMKIQFTSHVLYLNIVA
jgi:hypothetical protein